MSQNIAIIDLGSNLTKLVVLNGAFPLQVIHRSIYDTKTLKNAPKGFFDEFVISKIENDINTILNVAKEFHCATILGIATSAFRTRKNGQEVINSINEKFSTKIEIIEGEREAHLIHKGAIASVTPKSFPVLVMDIGGGSTEFIIGNETEILWKHSFDFGSTALTKDIEVSDPLNVAESETLNHKTEVILPTLFDAITKFKPVDFIGTTGAFESFAQIIEYSKGNTEPVKSGYCYSLEQLKSLVDQLTFSSNNERAQMKGMNPMRIPTINIAALILNHVLQRVTFQNYYLSLGDVKEGLGLEYLEQNI